jgi:hypothetical protein
MGFRVRYADGATEVWPVNPGSNTTIAKLFDTPAPGSLKLPKNPGAGCRGA